MSEDAIKIITALRIDKCYLLRYSLGGFLAQTIAYKRAGLVQKLILVGTAPQGAKALYIFPELVARAFSLEATESFLYIFAKTSTTSRAKLKAALGGCLRESKTGTSPPPGLPYKHR